MKRRCRVCHDVAFSARKCGDSFSVSGIHFVLNCNHIGRQLIFWIGETMLLQLSAQEEKIPLRCWTDLIVFPTCQGLTVEKPIRRRLRSRLKFETHDLVLHLTRICVNKKLTSGAHLCKVGLLKTKQIRLEPDNAKKIQAMLRSATLAKSATQLVNHILKYYGIPEFEKNPLFRHSQNINTKL
jgi:hypothetical protein